MKRSIALLVGVAAVFVLAARPVAATPGAPGAASTTTSVPTSGSVPTDAIGVVLAQVTGSGLAVTLDPGGTEEHDLVVSNHTANLRLTVKLTATDATGNLGTAAASWIAFGDDSVQLDPHAAATVPMTIAVPHDTQPESALAHVTATVESAVGAVDGSPVAGTASRTFPVSISVQGTPTAQIAIADVHRVDKGSHHELAIVLRNFGAQGAQVSGHVVVGGDHPQTLPFSADLAASRDTTVDLPWNAPPVGTPSDVAVDLEYGSGNVASWSSRLGGAPADLSGAPGAPTTATTAPVTSVTAPAPAASASVGPAQPWWKQPFVTVGVILALLGAGVWFAFEMRASSRRRDGAGAGAAYYGVPPGWVPASGDASADLAKQLVRLTEIIVELTTTGRAERELSDDRPRARSPDPVPAGAPSGPLPFRPFEGGELRFARAGPAPPAPGPPAEPVVPMIEQPEVVRSASPTPGAVARPAPEAVARPAPEAVARPAPEAVARPAPEAVARPALHAVAEPEPDDGAPAPRSPAMDRLLELDRRRRELRAWMDAEDSGVAIDPPPFDRIAHADGPEPNLEP